VTPPFYRCCQLLKMRAFPIGPLVDFPPEDAALRLPRSFLTSRDLFRRALLDSFLAVFFLSGRGLLV